MLVTKEVLVFCEFVIIGVLIAVVFDFFRALRKCKKYRSIVVTIQDFIFWLFTAIIIFVSTFYLTNGEIRLYMLIAMVLGVVFYIGSMSPYVTNGFIRIIKSLEYMNKMLFMPVSLLLQIMRKTFKIIANFAKKCCNKVKSVVFLLCRKVKSSKNDVLGNKGKKNMKRKTRNFEDNIKSMDGELCLNQTKDKRLRTY